MLTISSPVFRVAALMLSLLASACTTVPPTNVHQPMTARPAPRPESTAKNGAIFQASTSRPLFEDRRARFVGDTLTVTLTETTSASTSANNNLDRTSESTGGGLTVLSKLIPGSQLLGNQLLGSQLAYDSNTNFSATGAASNTNRFTGSVTVTVIDTMSNGNLLVSGEKMITVGRETQFVRVSGVVNPNFITLNNSIDSTKVADARIEYKANGQIDEAQSMGWLARFFLNILPF